MDEAINDLWNLPPGTVRVGRPKVRPVFKSLMGFILRKPAYYQVTHTFQVASGDPPAIVEVQENVEGGVDEGH